MRKASIVFLALLVVVSVCFWYAHSVFLDVADDVTVKRQTLFGDPAAADGVNILVRNHYQHKLMWETTLTLDNDPVPETDFTFSNESIYLQNGTEYSGVAFNVVRDVFMFDGKKLPESVKEKYRPLSDALNAAFDAVPEGESKTITINFADYLDYYPLEGHIILPEYTTMFSELDHWTTDSEKIALAINNFFRIPLDRGYTVEYTIDKTNPGSAYGASVNMNYYIDASGVATANACYFSFNTRMKDGTFADTSLIPGGYGIYCLPYDESGLKLDDLEMVYALDPLDSFERMQLSTDGKRIRLYTRQDNDLMLTVIDVATMTQLQKVKVLTYSDEWYYSVNDYDDFTLITENRRNSDSMDKITVWEELPDGTWAHAFTTEMNLEVFPEGSNLNLFSRHANAVDYIDGKLVVICHRTIFQEPYWYKEYIDIYVTVYEATGMTYAGTCEWNLTQITALRSGDQIIRPLVAAPLEVSW